MATIRHPTSQKFLAARQECSAVSASNHWPAAGRLRGNPVAGYRVTRTRPMLAAAPPPTPPPIRLRPAGREWQTPPAKPGRMPWREATPRRMRARRSLREHCLPTRGRRRPTHTADAARQGSSNGPRRPLQPPTPPRRAIPTPLPNPRRASENVRNARPRQGARRRQTPVMRVRRSRSFLASAEVRRSQVAPPLSLLGQPSARRVSLSAKDGSTHDGLRLSGRIPKHGCPS